MSDTEKREAVLERFYAKHYGKLEPLLIVDDWVMDDMADRIVELEAAVERVRALHNTYPDYKARWCRHCKTQEWPCLTLRALEETP